MPRGITGTDSGGIHSFGDGNQNGGFSGIKSVGIAVSVLEFIKNSIIKVPQFLDNGHLQAFHLFENDRYSEFSNNYIIIYLRIEYLSYIVGIMVRYVIQFSIISTKKKI